MKKSNLCCIFFCSKPAMRMFPTPNAAFMTGAIAVGELFFTVKSKGLVRKEARLFYNYQDNLLLLNLSWIYR